MQCQQIQQELKGNFTLGDAEEISLMGVKHKLPKKRPQRHGIQQEKTWGK